jgi:hypothetical protein
MLSLPEGSPPISATSSSSDYRAQRDVKVDVSLHCREDASFAFGQLNVNSHRTLLSTQVLHNS